MFLPYYILYLLLYYSFTQNTLKEKDGVGTVLKEKSTMLQTLQTLASTAKGT